jgi:hypothetical protein
MPSFPVLFKHEDVPLGGGCNKPLLLASNICATSYLNDALSRTHP